MEADAKVMHSRKQRNISKAREHRAGHCEEQQAMVNKAASKQIKALVL
jgi:hypothetical protein